ncbi:DUF563 domain containing protein [Nitzschia inconspicua]|uniref:DUF563 domain containing protein n=1 Tax=Nitzschia inconspicua TaxID=303405 RepID=A0A9K3KYB7_9STRA|nr:DUF563 domain containing protein [Nitzschia inconspicua]
MMQGGLNNKRQTTERSSVVTISHHDYTIDFYIPRFRHHRRHRCRFGSYTTIAVAAITMLAFVYYTSNIHYEYMAYPSLVDYPKRMVGVKNDFHPPRSPPIINLTRYFQQNSTFPYFQESLYPRYTPLEKIFRPTVTNANAGQSSKTNNSNNNNSTIILSHLLDHQSMAVCNFRQRGMHFPHFFQEFLRCVSWWRATSHMHNEDYYYLGSHPNQQQRSPQQTPAAVLIFPTDTNRRIGRSDWANGLLAIMESQPPFHLQIDRNGTYRNISVFGQVPAVHDMYNRYVKATTTTISTISTLKTTMSNHKRQQRRSAYQPGDVIPPAFETAHPNDAMELQHAVWKGLHLSRTARGGCPIGHLSHKTFPIIGFLNRRPNNGRHVMNHRGMEVALRHAFERPNFRFVYQESFDSFSFSEQVAYMANLDIVLGPHGAQLTNAAFLPRCGGMLEFFPQGYWAPHYFGTMARTTGHYHFGIYAGDRRTMEQDVLYAMTNTLQTQDEARARNISIDDVQEVVDATMALVQRWYDCCVPTQP